jgi:hypothetical protein
VVIRPPFDSWFLTLPEPYRFLAQKASQKQATHAETRRLDHPCIMSAFTWYKTPEKSTFWSQVYTAQRENTPLPTIKKTAVQWMRCGILNPVDKKRLEAKYKTLPLKTKSDLKKMKFESDTQAFLFLSNIVTVTALNMGAETAKNQVKKKKNAKKSKKTGENCREISLIPSGESFFRLTHKRA